MNHYGVVVKDGVVKGFRMPEHEVYNSHIAEQEESKRARKLQVRRAVRALEIWSRWLNTSDGYGGSSCDIHDGDRMPAGSKIPIGCEIPEPASKVISTFEVMKGINDIHKRYVFVLTVVYRDRKEKENINDLIKRAGFSDKQFRNAKERFAQLYQG